MPRTGRGGAVQGQVGKAYPNRSDLRAAEPVVTAPSQQYGERAAQQAAQSAIPIASSPTPAPAATPAPATPAAAPPPPGGVPSPMPSRPAGAFPSPPPGGPGILPFLHPSNRPNEPVTAGLPTGPGPGPESATGIGAIVNNGAAEQGTLKNLLSSMAQSPVASSAVRSLAEVAGAG